MPKLADTPKIRFPEFDSSWRLLRISTQLSLATRPIKMDDHTDYQLVTVQRRNGGLKKRIVFKGKQVLVKSQFLLNENDFVISKRQIVHGACELVPKELVGAIVSNEYNVFTPTSNADINYFNYFSKRPSTKHSFFTCSIGVHIEKMLFKTNDWLKTEFNFPTLPEQEKIAAFLTSVDARIEQLKRKKSFLQDYKKGVMQRLFSQQLRFKDQNGNNYPDWQEKKLGEICSFIKDGTHGTHPNDESSKYRLLSAKNITKSGTVYFDDTDRRISEDEYRSIYKNYSLKKGDVLLSVVGTIGRVAIFSNEENVAFQRSVAFLRFEDESSEFMFQQFRNITFQRLLIRRQVTSAQAGIYLGEIARIPVNIPTFAEQTKIANFLSTLDTKIEQVTQQITQTQTFKKGLLQQMFV